MSTTSYREKPGATAEAAAGRGAVAGPARGRGGRGRGRSRRTFRQQYNRYRLWFFGALVAVYVAVFNGQWQVTPDSALYRALGQSLAEGGGYVYLGEAHDHAYPGLPLVLAGFRRLLGSDLWPMLLLNTLLAGAGLTLVYRTLRRDYPRWIATAVVLITGLNAQLLQHTTRVLTDVPFFFVVCLTMYAQRRWAGGSAAPSERARSGGGARPWGGAGWLGLMVGALFLAAMLRPAFYVLLGAVGVAILVEAVRGSWRRSMVLAGGVAAAAAGWWLLDMRDGGHDEKKIRRLLEHPAAMPDRLQEFLPRLLTEHGMDAFFGIQLLPGLDTVLTLLLLAGALTLWRPRRPRRDLSSRPSRTSDAEVVDQPTPYAGVGKPSSAGHASRPGGRGGYPGRRGGVVFRVALVWLMLAVTLLFSGTIPRYYLVILPLLALGWVQVARRVGRWLPRGAREWVVAALIALPLVTNAGEAGLLILRQRQTPLLETYEHGYWRTYHELADAIARSVPPGQSVIGPQPRVLTFWSGRDTFNVEDILRGVPAAETGHALRAAGVTHVVLPRGLYKHRPEALRQLIDALPVQATTLPAVLNRPPVAGGEPAPIGQPVGESWVLLRVGVTEQSGQLTAEVVASGP